MELILRSNDKNSIAKIINLAKQLNVVVEQHDSAVTNIEDIEAIKKRLLNFRSSGLSSIKDPAEWQREQRDDRDLPLPK